MDETPQQSAGQELIGVLVLGIIFYIVGKHLLKHKDDDPDI